MKLLNSERYYELYYKLERNLNLFALVEERTMHTAFIAGGILVALILIWFVMRISSENSIETSKTVFRKRASW